MQIDAIYDYYRSLGVTRQDCDFIVTDKLQLIEKPKSTTKMLMHILDCMWGSHSGNTDPLLVLARLKIELGSASAGSRLYNRILFVFGVVKNIALNLDPELKSLARVNFMRHLYGQKADDECVNTYLDSGSIERCTQALENLQIDGASYWQTHISRDILGSIFLRLPIRDFLHARSTCKRWRRIAVCTNSLEKILFSSHRLYLSSLMRTSATLEHDFIRNRRFVTVFGDQAKSSTRVLQEGCERLKFAGGESESLANCEQVTLMDNKRFYVCSHDSRKIIPHSFINAGNIYELVFESVDKIYYCQSLKRYQNASRTMQIYEIDKANGITSCIYHDERDDCFGFNHGTYHRNRLVLTSVCGFVFTFDLAHKTMHSSKHRHLKLLRECRYFHTYAVYKEPDFMVVDITDPSKPPICVPNSSAWHFITGTPYAFYLWSPEDCTVFAYESATGNLLQKYEEIPYLFPVTQSGRCYGNVSNGLLYLCQENQYYVIDLLTKQHLANIPCYKPVDEQIIAYKILCIMTGVYCILEDRLI